MSVKLCKKPLILQCQAIYISTSLLASILPFNQQTTPEEYPPLPTFEKFKDLIENCKFQYIKLKEKEVLPIREQLSQLEQEILSMTHGNIKKKRKNQSERNVDFSKSQL